MNAGATLPLLLATDLDGAFLAGTPEPRHQIAREFVATHGLGGGMVDSLHQALVMPEGDRSDRRRTMFEIVSRFDLSRWGSDFLEAVEAGSSASSVETRVDFTAPQP